jgi:hypothetical protein
MTDKPTIAERAAAIRARARDDRSRATPNENGHIAGITDTVSAAYTASGNVGVTRTAETLVDLDPGNPPAWRDNGHGIVYVMDPLRIADAMEWIIEQHRQNPNPDPRLRLADIQISYPTDGSPIMLLALASCDVGL